MNNMTSPEFDTAARGHKEKVQEQYRMHALMTCHIVNAWGAKVNVDDLLGVQDVDKALQEMDAMADNANEEEVKLNVHDFENFEEFKKAARALTESKSKA